MNNVVSLGYDGSYDGFLTCVFQIFEQQLDVHNISVENLMQASMFGVSEIVLTDPEKAERVKRGLKKRISASGNKQLYWAFLSEMSGIEMNLLQYIKLAFNSNNFSSTDYGNHIVLKINQIAKQVHREKHRMEAFVRFKLTHDEIFFASIEPDFNVLPIILDHFESRYADQKWIIYDLIRNFGIFYNLEETIYINLNFDESFSAEKNNLSIYKASEIEFQKLWKEYFASTNIKSRKNMKLHLQHVPKRYWKYLTEKSTWQN